MNAALREGVDDGVEKRCGGARGARLAYALDAEGIGGGRNRMEGGAERREVVGPGHCVIHQASSQELPGLRRVDAMLAKGLPEPLGDAAMHLSLGERRLDHGTAIVDADEGGDGNGSRLGIDLDLGDVASAWKGPRHRDGGLLIERRRLVRA